MDLLELKEQLEALTAAKNGDLSKLADRLEAGKLSRAEQAWLISHLRGEHKKQRGRPKGAQQKNHQSGIKNLFGDNNEIDFEAFISVEYLFEWYGMDEYNSVKKISTILNETAKNTKDRLERVKRHIESGEDLYKFINCVKLRNYYRQTHGFFKDAEFKGRIRELGALPPPTRILSGSKK